MPGEFFQAVEQARHGGWEQGVLRHPVAVGGGDGGGTFAQRFEGGWRGRVRDDQAVVAVAHQLAVGRQVAQQRHAAVGHRLEHGHGDRIAPGQAHVPLRAAIAPRLRLGVEPAGEGDGLVDAEVARLAFQRLAQRAVVRHHEAGLRAVPQHLGEQRQHALGTVDRLQAAVRVEQPRVLRRRGRRQRVETEREGHHVPRAEGLHARGHVQRVAGAHGAGPQHAAGQHAVGRRACRGHEDVAAPRRAHEPRAQAPQALGQPGERAVRGQVVGVDPVRIHVAQPPAEAGQRPEQAHIAAAVGRVVAEREPLRRRHEALQLGQEAAAGSDPQRQSRHGRERTRPLEQVRALAVAEQHVAHQHASPRPAQAS